MKKQRGQPIDAAQDDPLFNEIEAAIRARPGVDPLAIMAEIGAREAECLAAAAHATGNYAVAAKADRAAQELDDIASQSRQTGPLWRRKPR